MVKFPKILPEKAHEMSKFLEEDCTKTFVPPMRLEYKNLFCIYLLENKKRYAGRVWSPNIRRAAHDGYQGPVCETSEKGVFWFL